MVKRLLKTLKECNKRFKRSKFYRAQFLVVAAIVGISILGVGYVHYVNSRNFNAEAPAGQTPTNPLPFDLPLANTLKADGKKVFAHYFTPYPISVDNKDASVDYYTTQYLNPNGEGGAHAAYGGFLRERPLARAVDPSSNWRLDDMKTEVARADAAGLDGFTVDMLALSGGHWQQLNLLLQAAAAVDPSFKIVLMPDSASSEVENVNTLASSIASIANSSALYKLADGRLVIAPFYPEKYGLAYWTNFLDIMKSKYGINVAFVPCYLNYEPNASSWASISYGSSNWGRRSPSSNTSSIISSLYNDAHSRGKIWMQPVSVQDNRPKALFWTEADNSENLRATWTGAISGADWVQIPTWNDYGENTQIAPSTHIGYGPLDISSYYLTWFKKGSAPTITHDVIYVSYRTQPANMTATGETNPMHIGPGSPARDDVEVLSFLTSSATITLKVGASTYAYSAPAGISSKLYPIEAGNVYANVTRGGSLVTDVSGKFPIVSSRAIQDEQYYYVSSGRDGLDYGQSSTPALSSPSTSRSSSTPNLEYVKTVGLQGPWAGPPPPAADYRWRRPRPIRTPR